MQATTLFQQARYQEAIAPFERVLEFARRRFGPQHPDTLGISTMLAQTYTAAGRRPAAIALLETLARDWDRSGGADDLAMAQAALALGDAYRASARLTEANAQYLRAGRAVLPRLARADSATLVAAARLARSSLDQGLYREAIGILEQLSPVAQRSPAANDHLRAVIVEMLGEAYNGVGRNDEAERLLVVARRASIAAHGLADADAIGISAELAATYQALHRFAEAEVLLSQVLQALQQRGDNDPDFYRLLARLGESLGMQGRRNEAEQSLLRALDGLRQRLGPDHFDTLRVQRRLASLIQQTDRLPEAEALLTQALAASERSFGPNNLETLAARLDLAGAYLARRNYREALSLLARLRTITERSVGADHPLARQILAALVECYARQERYGEAAMLQEQVLARALDRLGRDHNETIMAANRLAFYRLHINGRESAALAAARTSTEGFRQRRASANDAGTNARAARERRETSGYWMLVHLDALWSAAHPSGRNPPVVGLEAEAFSVMQEVTYGLGSAAVSQQAAERIAARQGGSVVDQVRDRGRLEEQWRENERRLTVAEASEGAAAAEQRQALRSERAQLDARLTAIDARLRRDFPRYFALLRPEPVTLATAQAALAPDEAVLVIIPSIFGTHVMAVTRDRLTWERSIWTFRDVRHAVTTVLSDIRATMAGRGFRYDRRTAYELYRQMVAPVAAALAGKRHVFAVVTESLGALPLGVLVSEPPQGSDDGPAALRATHWFAEDHALSQIPSIQALLLLRQAGFGRPEAASGFVGFGDPLLGGRAVTRGSEDQTIDGNALFAAQAGGAGEGLADVAQLRRLNRLPGTATELENMRVALRAPPSSVFVAERATERAFRAMDFSRTSVLALATHGLVAGDLQSPAEPGLVFTPPFQANEADDGFLSASEVAALRLDADWVILSACNTAADDGSVNGQGLSGLARTFFFAGAHHVLASYWPVSDEAAPRLTVRTIALSRDGNLSRAEALRQAMRDVRDDPAHPAWAHPGVWAPFSLIGDGAR